MGRLFQNIFKSFLILILGLLILLAILCGYLASAMICVAKDTPKVDVDTLMANLKENSRIVDSNGQLIQTIETEEYRQVVTYDQIPQNLINAFISAEDKNFWDHNGIDMLGFLSAGKDMLTGGGMRGASTITMQMIRNTYLTLDVDFTRKLQEIYLSLWVEDQLAEKYGKQRAKEMILEAYLNRIFFGQNAYGVQGASKIYFSKDVRDLDLAQCATLASIVKAPSSNALYFTLRPSEVTDERVLGETTINGERYICVYNAPAYKRSQYVLAQMEKNGYITSEEHQAALKEDVAATIHPPIKRADNISSYVTDLVKDQAVTTLMDSQNISRTKAEELLYYGGLTITSTIDLNMQRKLQERVGQMNAILNGDTQGETSAQTLDLSYDDAGNIVNDDGVLQYYRWDNLMTDEGEVLIPPDQYSFDEKGNLTLSPRRVRAYGDHLDIMDAYTINEYGILHTHRIGTIPVKEEFLHTNDDGTFTIDAAFFKEGTPFYRGINGVGIALSPEYYYIDKVGTMQPQTSVTVLDTKTGEVRAVIGGREQEENTQFVNRATSYPRQPGSSFKPIAVYAGVFGTGRNMASTQDDTPFQMLDGSPWPRNVTGRYQGLMTVEKALEVSSNPVAVKWLNAISIKTSKEYLEKFGIINRAHPDRDHFVEASEDPKHNDENLPMALGALTDGMTTLDMAGAFQAIGNNGNRIPAMSISKIVDNEGKVYYENEHQAISVLPPAVNYQLLLCLINVVENGFAGDYIDRSAGIQIAGKTGTTSGNTDFWFNGITPYYTISVWVGADNGYLSLDGNSGVAASLFNSFSKTVHEGLEARKFEQPSGLYEVEVSLSSGKLPTDACRADSRGMVGKILVSKETAPKEPCDVHVFAEVDRRNNLLASDTTPPIFRVSRSFIKRPIPYNPSDFNGVVPEDWAYKVPTAYSDLPATVAPEVIKNSDGSVTTITYTADWTKVETTTYPDGRVVQVSTTLDGTVTTKETKPVTPTPSPGGATQP